MNTTRRQALLLLAFCSLLYLPGLRTTPFYSRGEAREALAVREVAESGRWLVPMRPDGQLTKKPPLFYWTGALAMRVLPSAPEGAIRMPSAITATIGVLAMALLGGAAVGSAAPLAAVIAATSFEWMRAATSARVDMLLAAGMTLVLLGWTGRLGGRAPRTSFVLVVLGTVMAILAKGPIGVGFPAAALVVTALVARDPALLRLLVPLGLGAMAAGGWYVAAWLMHGRAFVDVVLSENLGRFVDTEKARTGHAHGPLFLVLVGLLGLLPWTPLLPLTMTRGTAPRPIRTLLVAWIATIVTVVLLSASKRSVYLLPIFPAVALLLADGFATAASPRMTRVLRATTAFYAPVLGVLGLTLLATATGLPLTRVLHAVLDADDLRSLGAVETVLAARRVIVAAVAIGLLALATAAARARTARAWKRLVPLVTAAVTVTMLVFELGIHPVVARTLGFADFMPRVSALVPPGEPVYAFFPVDQGVRYYSERPLVRWQERPGEADVFFLGWEREVESLHPTPGTTLERLAVSEARHGGRGRLVLVRVPRGALPRRQATSPQNG